MHMTSDISPRSSISARLFAAFGGMLGAMLLAAGLAAYGLWLTVDSNQQRAELAQRLALVGQWSQSARINLERVLNLTRLEAAIGDSEADKARLAPVIERMVADITETALVSSSLKDKLATAVAGDADLAQVTEEVEKRRQAFVALRASIRDDLALGEGQARIDKELLPSAQAMLDSQVRLTHLLSQRGEAANAKLQHHAQRAMQWLGAGLLAALLIGTVVALSTARAVARPLREATALARRVADGDLTAPVHSTRGDEIGQLMRALADMQAALRRLVDGIRTTAGGVQAASTEVADGSLDLNQRSDRAAGSLQHTTAAIESLQGVVAETVQAAHAAASRAHSAVDVARSGNELVSRVVRTMQDMASSSRKVEEIVGIIDGIAFRTNILALNAAVEAARSGEHGRGFAVVASEVRTLAQRSASAAREIKALIASSTASMAAGSQLAADAGNTMLDIVARITEVDQTIGEIDRAAQSQATGIDAVTASVAELERVIQINASMVEQTASSADGLNRQASALADAVSRFHCDETEAA